MAPQKVRYCAPQPIPAVPHHGLHAITLETVPVMDLSTGTPSLVDPGSRWVLLARVPELLDRPRYAEIAARDPLPDERHVLWTDDFSNLIEVLDW